MSLVEVPLSSSTSIYGTVSESSAAGTRYGWKVFDNTWNWGDRVGESFNDIEYSWQSDRDSSGWIQFEFSSSAIIDHVEFIPNWQGPYGGLTLKRAQLQASNDGTNFVDISSEYSYSNSITYAQQWNTIPSNDTSTSYKYVRVLFNGYYTSSYGSGICIKEMRIYGIHT